MSSSDDWGEVYRDAERVMYVCRVYDPIKHQGAMVMNCADCGTSVSVTPSVLADRRSRAREAGRELEVVCDSCAAEFAAETGADVVAVMPSEEEFEAARTAQQASQN